MVLLSVSCIITIQINALLKSTSAFTLLILVLQPLAHVTDYVCQPALVCAEDRARLRVDEVAHRLHRTNRAGYLADGVDDLAFLYFSHEHTFS